MVATDYVPALIEHSREREADAAQVSGYAIRWSRRTASSFGSRLELVSSISGVSGKASARVDRQLSAFRFRCGSRARNYVIPCLGTMRRTYVVMPRALATASFSVVDDSTGSPTITEHPGYAVVFFLVWMGCVLLHLLLLVPRCAKGI